METQSKQRGDRDRYQRKQIARITAERDRAIAALKEAQAHLRQFENPSQAWSPGLRGVVFWHSNSFGSTHRISRRFSRLEPWRGPLASKGPCPQPSSIGDAARHGPHHSARLSGACPYAWPPLVTASFGMIDISIGLAPGRLCCLGLDAHHHQLTPDALSLERVHCIGVSVADAWTAKSLPSCSDASSPHGPSGTYLKTVAATAQSRRPYWLNKG